MRPLPYLDSSAKTPLEQVHTAWLDEAKVRLYLKRDDLIDPWISGNKWRKLYGYVKKYINGDYDEIVSWGSSWSNHIHACSALCISGIPVTAIVPEDRYGLEIPSLHEAMKNGLHVQQVSRSEFRNRNEELNRRSAIEINTLFIPEGGSGPLAKEGLQIMVKECLEGAVDPDFWLCAAGVGGQTVGIMEALTPLDHVISVECVKGAKIASYIAARYQSDQMATYDVWTGHQGGLGKWLPDMNAFLESWEQETHIRLDPLYTGKMLYALRNKILSGQIRDKTIIAIHSGGLIAWKNKAFKEK